MTTREYTPIGVGKVELTGGFSPLTTLITDEGSITLVPHIRKPVPKRIYRNYSKRTGRLTTVVEWEDETKTRVTLKENEEDDPVAAFCFALGIKLYETNSALQRAIRHVGGFQDQD